MYELDLGFVLDDWERSRLIFGKLLEIHKCLIGGGANPNKICLVANGPIADSLLKFYGGSLAIEEKWKKGWNIRPRFFNKWDFALHIRQNYCLIRLATNLGTLHLHVHCRLPMFWHYDRVLPVKSREEPFAYCKWHSFVPQNEWLDFREGF